MVFDGFELLAVVVPRVETPGCLISELFCVGLLESMHTFQGIASSENGMYFSSMFLPNLIGFSSNLARLLLQWSRTLFCAT